MNSKIITILLVLVGVINFLPVIGVISAGKLGSMYQVAADEPNLQILLRHRAILFGLLGAFIIYAAFHPHLLNLMFVGAYVSMVSFIVLAWQIGGYNEAINKVIIADIIAIVMLTTALILHCFKP